MHSNEYRAALDNAAKRFTPAASGPEQTQPGELVMLAHYLFDTTREAFCTDDASDTDRIFGFDTENEQVYERSVERNARMSLQSRGRAIMMLAEARRISSAWRRLPRDQKQHEARAMIRAVDAVYETIHALGPVEQDPLQLWQTRRPAFR